MRLRLKTKMRLKIKYENAQCFCLFPVFLDACFHARLVRLKKPVITSWAGFEAPDSSAFLAQGPSLGAISTI